MIDSHCHLADEVFSADLDAVVARARDAGLERTLVILEAGNAVEAAQARRLEQLWPEVRFSIGVHPHSAHQFAADPDRTATLLREQFASTPSARAVGEIGLDYHYDFSPRDVQHAVFRAQIRVARDLEQPVVIHTREADEDTLAILREEGGKRPSRRPALFHRNAGARGRRARARVLHLVRGHRHLSQRRQCPRGGPSRAARPAPGRNRQPVPGAGPVSGQAQRTGPRRPGRRNTGRDPPGVVGRPDTADHSEFPPPVPAVIKFWLETLWKRRRWH